MGLPSILRSRRRTPTEAAEENTGGISTTPSASPTPTKYEQQTSPRDSDATAVASAPPANLAKTDLRKATKVRKGFAISASVSYLLAFVFLILVSFWCRPATMAHSLTPITDHHRQHISPCCAVGDLLLQARFGRYNSHLGP